MKTYEFHSFIHSFNTYSSGREPCPWFIVRHQGTGTIDFLHRYQTLQNQLFSDEQIIFPNFYFFLDTSTFPGKTWLTEGSTHLPQPLGKASVFARYQNRLQWVCYNNPLFHFSYLFFLQEYKVILRFSLPLTAQPHPIPRLLTWPSSPLQEWAGPRARTWVLSFISVLLYLEGRSVRCFKVYLASVLTLQK